MKRARRSPARVAVVVADVVDLAAAVAVVVTVVAAAASAIAGKYILCHGS